MSIYKPASWGRTRRPKAPNNVDKNFITGAISLATLNSLDESEFTADNGCYRTENQRFAHVACSGSSNVTNMYAYNYAMGYWHELVTGSVPSSVVVSEDQHHIIEIMGADWVALNTGSAGQRVTMAFSTF
jgi:hypothetical protein